MLERLRTRGGRVAIWIVVTVALTSIVTSLVAIVTGPTIRATGTLGTVQSIAEFSGAVIGFVLLVAAWGMRRGYRLAYVAAAGLVVLAAGHGVVQFRLQSVPLVVIGSGGFVVLLLTSDQFTRSSSLSGAQLGSLVSFVGVLCYGTVGAYALRDEFAELQTVVDAIYFTLVTASTVGYGDVHPTGYAARLFAISLVLLGPATVAVVVGSLLGPAVERYFTRVEQRAKVNLDSEHPRTVVVLGYDETAAPIVAELARRNATVRVVTTDADAVPTDDLDVDVLAGDPTEDRTLDRAGLDDAELVLAATADAAKNSYAVISARERTDARIVAFSDPGRENALERAGADAALAPEDLVVQATIGAAIGTAEPDAQSAASAASHSG
ncbi:NAD-binding protein [Halosolutus gelatinilyticus]|uniref:NAD-binding protein n=1 Tax=Halosolutus gelatinilyticus TaxID=2931975 RepID=UPI001FF1A3F4|nr:NAD-binding protein [Halosolutus gelatinilyticus]